MSCKLLNSSRYCCDFWHHLSVATDLSVSLLQVQQLLNTLVVDTEIAEMELSVSLVPLQTTHSAVLRAKHSCRSLQQ
jgi:hypothetical protein